MYCGQVRRGEYFIHPIVIYHVQFLRTVSCSSSHQFFLLRLLCFIAGFSLQPTARTEHQRDNVRLREQPHALGQGWLSHWSHNPSAFPSRRCVGQLGRHCCRNALPPSLPPFSPVSSGNIFILIARSLLLAFSFRFLLLLLLLPPPLLLLLLRGYYC